MVKPAGQILATGQILYGLITTHAFVFKHSSRMDGGFYRLVKTNPMIPSETQLSFQTSPVLICVYNTELSACQRVEIDGQMPLQLYNRYRRLRQ